MTKKDTNIKKIIKLKTIKIDEETHTDLKIYAAGKKFKTLGDAVRDLLDKLTEKT